MSVMSGVSGDQTPSLLMPVTQNSQIFSSMTVMQKISAAGDSSHMDYSKGGAHEETQCP